MEPVEQVKQTSQDKFSCEHCDKSCCKYTPIELNASEYRRFELYLQSQEEKLQRPVIKKFSKGYHTRYFIIPPCPFLGGDGKCRTYAFRPEICHVFPAQIGLDKFYVALVCPEAFRLYNEQKMQLIHENLSMGVNIIYREFMCFKYMPIDTYERYKQDLIELDAEVRAWVQEFNFPESLPNKKFVGLNNFKDIAALKEFVPSLDESKNLQ